MRTLSITVNDDLYGDLKQAITPGQISKFVSEAIRARLEKQRKELIQAYQEASQDLTREAELEDWDKISESW
jgi:predicted CopG family antitoxin